MNYVDPDGRLVGTALDIISVASGVKNLIQNIKAGNVKDAILDGAGIAVDILAAAIPIVPGGVGMLRASAKVANGADNVADATKNTSKLQESAKFGQEAHRQIEADLKHADPRIRTEVTIELDKKRL